HDALVRGLSPNAGWLPFPYPPPFLMMVTPFGFLPYWLAFASWVVLTGAIYVWVVGRVAPMPYTLAHPSALQTVLIGQNGFLTSSILVLGTAMLRTRPLTAGLVLGTLVIKPHLALLLPVAVLAGRTWQAIPGAIVSGSALLMAAWLLFGSKSYSAFLALLLSFASFVQESRWPWDEFISVFAFGRYFGLSQTAALIVHSGVALTAAGLTWVSWARDWPEKIAILATATILVPPYLLTYDAMLLIVPLGLWIAQGRRPLLIGVVWLLCALPIGHFFNLYEGPNTVPVAGILCLWALSFARAEQTSASHASSPAAV
ncbi:MAG TPA: glycosyltransferase family 87 protein, partial [Sphingomicrobium sp.]